jgi:hypothetical protein
VVQITGLQTTTQDFELVLNQPEIAVSPLSMEESLVFGDQATQTLNIDNLGVAPLNWDITEQNRGMIPSLSIPPFEGTLPADDAPASTGRAPNPPAPTGAAGELPWLLAGEPAYALDVYPGYNLVYIPDTTVPGTWNVIAPVPQFHSAADFLNGDFSTLYALDYDTNQFVTIDTTSGARTVIGTATGNGNWSGMTGATDGTLYAVSSVCGTSSTLYTIDPATGALTQIGNITNATCMIDIAINAQGEMYGVDIVNDVLVQVDPATGAGTVVGSLGVSANYAQGMDFEEDTGILYWAAYTTQGELRIIDTATGASTLVGAFPGGNEVDGLAFATGGGGGGVPWLSENPANGTLPPSSGTTSEITFDSSAVSEPGTYLANLNVNSDDPFNARVTVAVTMTVLPSGDIGKLEGYVMGLGYCDADSYPAEAEIVIESSTGMTWTTTSDPATGYYYRWLNEDTYTLFVSAPEHVDDQATVQVTAGQTTTQDFDLRYIESCMDYTPPAFDLTILEDSQLTETLSIFNDGAGDLTWELRETTRTLSILSIPPFEGTLPEDTAPLSFERAPAASGTSPQPSGLVINGAPAYGVNLFDDTLYTWPDVDIPGTWNPVGAPGIGSAYSGDFAGSDFSILYIINNDNQSLYAVDTATGASTLIGPSPAPGLTWTGMSWDPTTAVMYGSATEGVTAVLYTIDLATGATTQVGPITGFPFTIDIAVDASGQMYGVDISTDELILIDKYTGAASAVGSTGFAANYAQGLDFDEDAGILYWAAYGASGELRVIDPATGGSVYIGAFPGGAEVDSFAIMAGGGGPLWTDVPWVSEVPTNGLTAPDSVFDVDVIFDSTGLTVGECYTANLGLIHDDPGWDETLYIPLRLCVQECIEMTGMEMTLMTPDPVVGVPVQFEVDMTPDNMSMPYNYEIDMGDDTVYAGDSSDDPHGFSHIYTEAGPYTVEFRAWNCGMTEPMTDSMEITVSEAVSRYYLPIIVKNY